MGYFEMIKRGFKAANRNLPAILAQILLVIGILALVAFLVLIFIAMFAGSIAGLNPDSITPEKLSSIIGGSVTLIFVGVLALIFFFIFVFLMGALVQSGIIGCLVQTVRGDAEGFTASGFFTALRKSGISLFWFQIIIFLIVVGVFIAFGVVAGIGFGFILMPLKQAGNQIAAFAIGVPFITVLILLFLVLMFLSYAGGMFGQISLVDGGRGAFSAVSHIYSFLKERFWDAILFTLLIAFLLFCTNVAVELVSLPFRIVGEKSVVGTLVMVPIMLIAGLVKMYIALIAHASFVVYYVNAVTPPAPLPAIPQPAPTSPGDVIFDAEILEPAAHPEPPGPSRRSEFPQEPETRQYPGDTTPEPAETAPEEDESRGQAPQSPDDTPRGMQTPGE